MGAGTTADKAATNATAAAAGKRSVDVVAMRGRAVFSGADDEDEE
jgi:hypothetical protein